MELIDRKTALDLGLTTYFTGKACLKGHITARRVGCGSCIECRRIRTKRSQKGKATSVYKGVNKHRNLWKVTLTINDNEVKIVRTFKTEIEAALCYDELAKEHYGEFAQLNFP